MNILNQGGEVRLTLVVDGNPVLARKPAAERFAKFLDTWNVPRWEALAYIERLERALGREIEEDEADRLLHPVFYVLGTAEELRRVLAGDAVALPFNEGRSSSYVEVQPFDDDLPDRVELYERELAEARRRRRA